MNMEEKTVPQVGIGAGDIRAETVECFELLALGDFEGDKPELPDEDIPVPAEGKHVEEDQDVYCYQGNGDDGQPFPDRTIAVG